MLLLRKTDWLGAKRSNGGREWEEVRCRLSAAVIDVSGRNCLTLSTRQLNRGGVYCLYMKSQVSSYSKDAGFGFSHRSICCFSSCSPWWMCNVTCSGVSITDVLCIWCCCFAIEETGGLLGRSSAVLVHFSSESTGPIPWRPSFSVVEWKKKWRRFEIE